MSRKNKREREKEGSREEQEEGRRGHCGAHSTLLVDDPAPRTRQRRCITNKPDLIRVSLLRVEQAPCRSKENRGELEGGEKPTATTRLGRE